MPHPRPTYPREKMNSPRTKTWSLWGMMVNSLARREATAWKGFTQIKSLVQQTFSFLQQSLLHLGNALAPREATAWKGGTPLNYLLQPPYIYPKTQTKIPPLNIYTNNSPLYNSLYLLIKQNPAINLQLIYFYPNKKWTIFPKDTKNPITTPLPKNPKKKETKNKINSTITITSLPPFTSLEKYNPIHSPLNYPSESKKLLHTQVLAPIFLPKKNKLYTI